jgi:hypothetical protein
MVSRTERERFSDEAAQTIPLTAELETGHVRVFRHLATSFCSDDKSYASLFWISVPLPA